MKITIKTLNGKQLPLEIENEWSIRQIKEACEKEHDLKADTLKLIAYGKVLDGDDKPASDYNIKEGDFVVAMVQKAKPAPKKPAEAPKNEEAKKEETESKPQTENKEEPKVEGQQQQPSQPNPSSMPQPNPPAQELSPEVEAAVNELMAISGKDKELCVRALAAAQGVPDIAFEFLLSGHIPNVPAGGGGQGNGQPQPEYDDEQDGDGENPLAQYNLDPQTMQAIQALVSNPSFPMIRQRMVQDPGFSQQFMSQLQQTQPAIFNAIQANPGILMALILGHDPMSGMGGGQGGPPIGGGQPQPGGQQQPPPGSIQVSPTEMEAIDRLTQLGFPKARAAEAFFACDKNEEMAANFLFESGGEDEDTALQAAMLASQGQIGGGQQQQPNPNPPVVEANPEPQPQPEQNEGEQQQQNSEPKPEDNNDKKDDENMDGDNNDPNGGGGGSSLA